MVLGIYFFDDFSDFSGLIDDGNQIFRRGRGELPSGRHHFPDPDLERLIEVQAEAPAAAVMGPADAPAAAVTGPAAEQSGAAARAVGPPEGPRARCRGG